METCSFDLPTMYGDHHVMEVRRILLDLSGVKSVYASSCFHVVEIEFDPAQIKPKDIEARLEQAAYLGALPIPQEISKASDDNEVKRKFIRHTTAYKQTQKTVAFAQIVQSSGRGLWPCPGIGILEQAEEES